MKIMKSTLQALSACNAKFRLFESGFKVLDASMHPGEQVRENWIHHASSTNWIQIIETLPFVKLS